MTSAAAVRNLLPAPSAASPALPIDVQGPSASIFVAI